MIDWFAIELAVAQETVTWIETKRIKNLERFGYLPVGSYANYVGNLYNAFIWLIFLKAKYTIIPYPGPKIYINEYFYAKNGQS